MRRWPISGWLAVVLLASGCRSPAGGHGPGASTAMEHGEPHRWGMHRGDEDLRRVLWELERIDHIADGPVVRR